MKAKFEDATIRNLPPAKESVYLCLANGEPGFGVRVRPSGTMTFFFQYKVDGQRRTMVLGNYVSASKKGGEQSLKDARELYQAELAKVKALRRGSADGVDPVAKIKRDKQQRISEAAAQSQLLTVSELITEYIEKHAKPNKRGWKEDRRILDHDALPEWGKRKAADITKRDVVLLLERIVNRGSPGSANNNFKIIRKMFAFAVERDILQQSPCVGIKMPAPLSGCIEAIA